MHSAVVGPLNHPDDLMGWCYLWEGNPPDGTFEDLSDAEIESEARAFAAKWLASLDRAARL